MAVAFDLDGWANVILPRPPSIMAIAFQKGDYMPFGTLRQAIKYVMEELDEPQRAVCWIVTQSGQLKGLEQFEELYRIIAIEGDDEAH